MSKELEALKCLEYLYCNPTDYNSNDRAKDYNTIKQALQRLEAIDNANPSEALELLGLLEDYFLNMIPYQDWVNTIENYILKAQVEHKALEIIKEHIKFEDRGIETYTDDLKNLVTKFMIRLESKDTGATFHIHLDTEEEFELLRSVLE